MSKMPKFYKPHRDFEKQETSLKVRQFRHLDNNGIFEKITHLHKKLI